MKTLKNIGKEMLCVGLLILGLSTQAQAALVPLVEVVYDTDRDLYWLGNANLAATNTFGLSYDTDLGNHPNDPYGSNYMEVIRPNGRMSWGAALHWIDAMNAANYLGFNNWRLPTALNADGSGPCGPAFNCNGSEMGHLFYDELGGTAHQSILDTTGPNYFTNLQPSVYWSGTEYAPVTRYAYGFGTSDGYQDDGNKGGEFYAWAVHPVPIPAAVWLFGTGAIGLLAISRRKR